MRPFFKILLAACALALCGLNAASAAWGGSCSPAVVGSAFAPSAPIYEWRTIDPDELALFCYGRQAGNLLLTTGEYQRRLSPGQWESEASEPPIPPPDDVRERIGAIKRKCGCAKGCACKSKKCGCKEGKRCAVGCQCGVKVIGGDGPTEKPTPTKQPTTPFEPSSSTPALPHGEELAMPVRNFGVAMDRISQEERSSINGNEVTREAALDAVGAGTVPDDSAKNSLTVMGGNAEQRKAAMDGLAQPQFAAWRESLIVQEYDADSPMLKCGFKVSSATPTIYLQSPSGKVLARVEGYDGPQTIERVRKADPNYDPSKDPPNKPKPSPVSPDGDDGSIVGAIAAAVGGLVCVFTFPVVCFVGLVLFVRSR